MTKMDEYKTELMRSENWDAFLRMHCALPGPRANLELIYAAAEVGDEEKFLAFCATPDDASPGNSPEVFLVCCGIVGLGKLINAGKTHYLQTLRVFASDERWRVREAVAMALQIVGDADMQLLLQEMQTWQSGNLLEKRAVVAALCEPRLLKKQEIAEKVLQILDDITGALMLVKDRKHDDFVVLKKGLSYGWSVAVVACPEQGKKRMEKWIANRDRDAARIMKENLQKNRLIKMDKAWVLEQQNKLAAFTD